MSIRGDTFDLQCSESEHRQQDPFPKEWREWAMEGEASGSCVALPGPQPDCSGFGTSGMGPGLAFGSMARGLVVWASSLGLWVRRCSCEGMTYDLHSMHAC